MSRVVAGLQLGLAFVLELVHSGFRTALMIILPGQRPSPATTLLPYSGLSAAGAATLGCLVTLTPGTSLLDVNLERRTLLLHLLDGRDPAGTVAGIRARFEQPLRRLFPEPGA